MSTALILFVLALAAPADVQTPPAPAASRSGSGVVEPRDDDNVIDDVFDSFHHLLNSSHDDNVRESVVFRIKQGRCHDARELAKSEGMPELVSLVDRTCTPKPQ